MLVEDVACLLKKWPALKKQCADQQPESLPRVSGCIDTRWEYTADALRSLIGLTVVLERLTTHALDLGDRGDGRRCGGCLAVGATRDGTQDAAAARRRGGGN